MYVYRKGLIVNELWLPATTLFAVHFFYNTVYCKKEIECNDAVVIRIAKVLRMHIAAWVDIK